MITAKDAQRLMDEANHLNSELSNFDKKLKYVFAKIEFAAKEGYHAVDIPWGWDQEIENTLKSLGFTVFSGAQASGNKDMDVSWKVRRK